MPAIAAQGHARGVDRLHRAHGVALDAGHLHQSANRVAGQPEVVFHADLGGVLDLLWRASEHFAQRAGSHRAGYAYLALAAHLGAGNRSVLLVEDADGGSGEQEAHHAVLVRTRDEAHVVMQQRRNDARRAIGGRRDHAPAAGVFLVDRQRIEIDPVEHVERIAQVGLGVFAELAIQARRAATHLEAAGHHAFGTAAGIDAVLHDLPDTQQATAGLCFRPPGGLVGEHQLADGQPMGSAVIEQLGSAAKGVGQCGGVLDDAIAAGGLFVDHESATHRVVLAATELQAGGVEGAEDQAVGVEGQRPADEGQLRPAVERDRVLAEQAQFATLADRRQARRDAVGIHRFGMFALQPEQHGLVAAVALAGSAERAVQLDLDGAGRCQLPVTAQAFGKAQGGAHRSHRVRAGRADTDLEQVEDTEGHWEAPGEACISLDPRPPVKVDREGFRCRSGRSRRRAGPRPGASRPRGWPPGCCAPRSRPARPGRWRR